VRLAVDALGGDNAPGEIVAGALNAARRLPQHEVILVGDDPVVKPLADGAPPNVRFRDAKGTVGMGEEAAASVRSRPDASVSVAANMVRGGEADAFFSAGSTGAAVAAALLRVGRIGGVRRPAIAQFLPLTEPVLLLDVGATVECRAQDLLNFAILGAVFARRYMGISEPRVGLVNVGEEPGKGDEAAREAHALLAAQGAVPFVGNVEGRDVGRGTADVLVTDGFTGNVMLKTGEGVARETLLLAREAIRSGGPLQRLAGAVLRPRLRGVRDRLDPEQYGGAFLLGVNGLVAIGHGNSRARGVENALLGISRSGSGLVEESVEALATARRSTADGGSS
jgi:glycerol-3-phosphate acyltransferase PlsX